MAAELTAAEAPGRSVTALVMLSHFFEARRGGIELVAAALARELASLDFRVVWLATGRPTDSSASDGRVCLRASRIVEALLKVPYPVLLPSGWRAIFRAVKAGDLVMAHDAIYLTSIAGFLAARLYRRPILLVQHVGFVPYRSVVLRTLMRLANRLVAAPILRLSDRVVFISELTRQHFAEVRWLRPPTLIFNGVDTHIFSAPRSEADVESARKSLALPPGVPIALFVGRFTEKKGLNVLERIVNMRRDVFFAFAGHGELDPQKWGAPNVAVFATLSGESIAPLYRACDVLVLPSVGEGFPLVVQEALASGLPVLCGRDTAQADPRAGPYLHGVAVDLDSPEQTARSFSEEMSRILGHSSDVSGRKARSQFAMTAYSWAAAASEYVRLLGRLRSDDSDARRGSHAPQAGS
ncbi:MAG: glycosyltransferase family 4 protein [Steroidobacteraceae bacterium]